MNYLAHAYLSFGNPALVTGNLISDLVKGRKRYDYPPEVQQGIALHRAIDEFTDSHEAIIPAKEIFRPAYRLYCGAFVDVVYDHFLANDPEQFKTDDELLLFSQATYKSLSDYYPAMPSAFHNMFNRMQMQNWLYNYRFSWGMERSFSGLVYRSKYMTESETAFKLFNDNYELLGDSYAAFFPSLKAFVQDYIHTNIYLRN